jgi:hypothetical protein
MCNYVCQFCIAEAVRTATFFGAGGEARIFVAAPALVMETYLKCCKKLREIS